ncbi:MAG: hypothetical protein AB2806_17845, partial [Candidatus Thiodiazotropha sp.]
MKRVDVDGQRYLIVNAD